MNALGAHIFAGGFTIGMQESFNILAHLERSEYGVASWKAYRPDVPVHVSPDASWDTKPYEGVDLLYGNPPCSIWSNAASNARAGTLPLKEWSRDVARVGRDVGAKVVVLESVRGAVREGAPMYRALRDEFGYKTLQFFLVNVYDHGLPQWRPRVFVLLFPGDGFTPRWEPTRPPKITDVIANAPASPPVDTRSIFISPKEVKEHPQFMELVSRMRQGENLRDTAERENFLVDLVSKIKWGSKISLKPFDDGCMLVHYGTAKTIHPNEARFLNLREHMRLVGYPDAFNFITANQQTSFVMLGKTVCPPVGAWLGREVAAHLLGNREASTTELVNCASPAPIKSGRADRVTFKTFTREKWLHENPAALASVKRGVAQAEAGETTIKDASVVEAARPPKRRPDRGYVAVASEPAAGLDFASFKGPVALARVLIAQDYGDETILATTQLAFGPTSDRPLQFVRRDLQRLRERIGRKRETPCSTNPQASSSS